MELDDMKLLLKQQLEAGSELQDPVELEAFIAKRTTSVISRIKRSLWFEFAGLLVCMIIAAWRCAAYPSLLVYIFCAAIWITSIAFCAYLLPLYRKIVFYETMPGTLRENLQQVIAIVSGFTRLYFRVSIGLLPVIFMLGLITGYLDVSQKGMLQQFHWSKGIVFYCVIFAGWSVFIWFFASWYIRKLYGHYLLQLQQQLKDMENG